MACGEPDAGSSIDARHEFLVPCGSSRCTDHGYPDGTGQSGVRFDQIAERLVSAREPPCGLELFGNPIDRWERLAFCRQLTALLRTRHTDDLVQSDVTDIASGKQNVVVAGDDELGLFQAPDTLRDGDARHPELIR